ncbi:YajQ family cyclic di-GMP-binding protein [Vibrio sp. CAIM 722]|uniref:Nucleotide-binding protein F9817_08740 n=1 Tax=Vibrio eleionomae TaxID=2653505 RepID=A0A7X4LK16_9VIBR|nr:YajQ family cyclic di-GMP-binding protein [Vibrio eleionomae]MZI93281.1 YajQ family cyclic di-GMP-binding protein [Vibrio eleionomae]
MPSFDIVSEIDTVELRNAVDNANRELSTRFDFRNVDASFDLSNDIVKLKAEGDFQITQMMDILRNNLAKRGVDPRSMDSKSASQSGKNWNKDVVFQQGIETLTAKKMVKMIKDAKLKVQASIQGDKVRVTGKKRDDLQSVIAMFKGSDLELPLQYNNFRD